jgi:hypothetical protein
MLLRVLTWRYPSFSISDIQQETINTTNSSITMNMNQSMKCNKLNFIYTSFFELKEHACRRLYGDQNITKARTVKLWRYLRKGENHIYWMLETYILVHQVQRLHKTLLGTWVRQTPANNCQKLRENLTT